MRIFSSTGNVLIQTAGTFTDSGEKLQVTGTAKITSNLFVGGFYLNRTNSGGYYSGTSDNFGFWYTGSVGNISLANAQPIVFSTSGAERMRLDASGNLGLGVTPSAWGSSFKALQIGTNGSILASGFSFYLGSNFYQDSSSVNRYLGNAASVVFGTDDSASFVWRIAPSGTAGNAITFTQAMTLDASGNLLLGSTTSSGERLQINGTAKITGKITAGTSTETANAFSGVNNSASQATIYSYNYNAAGWSVYSAQGINYFANNVGIGKTNPTVPLDVVGAATITGNLTVDTNTLFVDATNNRVGIGTASPSRLLSISSTESYSTEFYRNNSSDSRINITNTTTGAGGDKGLMLGAIGNVAYFYNYANGDAIFGTNATERARLTASGDFGIGMTPSYKLDVTGSARISDAIAIGTTPDTNNPFKILKNINATVGIKFENTNTSSLAFSAVQLGTDVSGGTKFTNLVYASSGVTASGVYNPDGTSLINNGNGGLNFLGNPIRMYTGGSNGVLRWDISNEGIIQYNATSPTTSATDAYKQYSADVTAGNAAPHFRTENGAVIKLYQETTSVGNSIFAQGGGNSVLDDSTFDGYTLRQIVKALRNQGILA
jgi:hypothetical protein